MPPKKASEKDSAAADRQHATTPKEREQQMIAYADALAEKQLRDGTASSQVITHYLKLGTSTHALEQEKLRNENLRMEAQIAQINSQHRAEDLMDQVLNAMKVYAGVDEEDENL